MSISVSDLHFAYGKRAIFDGISCSFAPNAMTGLVGPSGSGKSTLLALIMGQLAPAAGTIVLPPTVSSRGAADPSRFAWVMQTSNVFVRRSALDNVALPVRCQGVGAASARQRANDALGAVGLAHRGRDRSGLLSGGERQRVAVARALATEAPVLVADEPTISLDHANRDHLVAALRRVAERGAIVIVATHDPAVHEQCDQVVRL